MPLFTGLTFLTDIRITGCNFRRFYASYSRYCLPAITLSNYPMVKNYILTALRNILKNRVFSAINITGLAIGMACSILILMWVHHELGYDRFHPDHRSISRMAFRIDMLGSSLEAPLAMAPLADALKEGFPEIDDVIRINVPENYNVTVNNEHFAEPHILLADQGFFSFFGFDLETGDPATVLNAPFQIVITRDLARKYFGDHNPVGEVIRINNQHDYTITGIAASPPSNSHIQFSGVASFLSLYEIYPPGEMDQWLSISYFTYLKFNDNYNEHLFYSRLEDLFEEKYGEESREFGISLDPLLQPVSKIHLGSNMIVELSTPGNRTIVQIFFAISLFILVLACMNFMNLSIARSHMRSKEVGVRKVNGAEKSDLVGQFLGESLVYSFVALLIAIPLIELGLPHFNNITGLQLSFFSGSNGFILSILPLFVIGVGVLAGIYPAFVLSSGSPLRIMKGGSIAPTGRPWLRGGLIIFQLVISITLVICTITVWRQLDFINSRDLGFDKSNKLIIQLISRDTRSGHQPIKQHLLGVPGIKDISLSSSYPGMEFSATIYRPEGMADDIIVNHMSADHGYPGLMGIRAVEGRLFDLGFPTDSMAVLVNETAVRTFGWTDPLNKIITRGSQDNAEYYHVIGVVGDFHFRPVHRPLEPLVIHLQKALPRFMTIDVSPSNLPVTLAGIKAAWHDINPGEPFEFQMLSDAYDMHYRAEHQLSRMFTFFSLLAFVIASLGMYGMASFIAGSKTREIGIRKVFGSPVRKILSGFFLQFGWWLLIANVVAWVAGFYFMDRWLDLFAYKISPWQPFVFLGATLISVIVVLMAAGSRSLKAALANPADSLRHE
jgi:putative ABC transport system permease protein